ncbi:MAG: hypothetical protein KDA51_02400 [Planctomycetales bacterium]|nr:hypothetical protein [Planctomycetales bacterium]
MLTTDQQRLGPSVGDSREFKRENLPSGSQPTNWNTQRTLLRTIDLQFSANVSGGASIFDFSTFAYWFGSSVGTAPWYADLNHDGGVSIFDFSRFAGNFGTFITYPHTSAARAASEQSRAESVNGSAIDLNEHAKQRRTVRQPPERIDQQILAWDAAVLDLVEHGQPGRKKWLADNKFELSANAPD